MTWLSLLAGEAFAWLGLGLAAGSLDIAHGELGPVDLLYTPAFSAQRALCSVT